MGLAGVDLEGGTAGEDLGDAVGVKMRSSENYPRWPAGWTSRHHGLVSGAPQILTRPLRDGRARDRVRADANAVGPALRWANASSLRLLGNAAGGCRRRDNELAVDDL